MDKSTRVGNPQSCFVEAIEEIANQIIGQLLKPSNGKSSQLKTAPLGLSVATYGNNIWGLWLGQVEAERRQLAQYLQQDYTVEVNQGFHVVISDLDPHKGTDILAGARALQYVWNWHSPENVLLEDTPRERVAVLFNPCNEPNNNQGIGNYGTKAQLDILQRIVQEQIPELTQSLKKATTLSHAMGLLQETRRTVLEIWLRHLRITSEADDFFALLRTQLLEIRNFLLMWLESTQVWESWQSTIANYANPYSEVGREVQSLLELYEESADINALLHQVNTLKSRYTEHLGLGEGGQRALRLLEVCRYFQTFIVATDNQEVLKYLADLDPSLLSLLPPHLQTLLHPQGLDVSILGLRGINIGTDQAQKAIDLALHYARWQSPHRTADTQLSIAFLRDPLILHRGG
jgi:hypothetical protein